jgi:hypothetical protein
MYMKGKWVMQLYSREMMSKVVTERRKRIFNLVEGQEVLPVKTNTVKETNDFQCLVR